MKKINLAIIIIILLVPSIIGAKNYNYNTFASKQFKIHVPNNWKKKSTSNYVKIYPKKNKKKVFVKIKEVNLKPKGKKYLRNKKAKKFAKIYKKKIKKQYPKLNPKFQKANRGKIAKYKVIRLRFNITQGKLNAYYVTNKTFYHRLITKCKKKNCTNYNKKFKKIKNSFRFVPDETAPTFSGGALAESTSTSSITLSWDEAEDVVSNSNNIKYLIYEANQLEEQDYTTPTYETELGASSYQINNLSEGTCYYYVIRAEDEAGNIDTNTKEAIATTKITSNNEPTITDNPEAVTYISNGSQVQALMYRPPGTGPFPAIIYNHGGTTAADPANYASYATSLSEGGKYAVLITAYRGDIGSEGELSLSIGDVNDVLAAIEYVKSKDFIDSDRIGMFGMSRGANVTLSTAERNNTDLKAVVTWFPYTNLITYCEHIGNDQCLSLYGINPVNAESADYAHLLRIASPINFTSKLTMPLQNSHGTADVTVPYSQSEELNEAMDGMSNYTFYSYEGAGHGGDAVWSTTAVTRYSEFFSEYLE
ncbi:MAG: prolyl oligopeptidase family serine peptidase [Patescibacteria group bacterium]